MADALPLGRPGTRAGFVLGGKLDSILHRLPRLDHHRAGARRLY
jgi:hypothetical protein